MLNMNKILNFSILVLLLTNSLSAWSIGFEDCPKFFYSQQTPTFTNARLSNNTQELCMDGFAVMHSGVSRTPLWSAEYLTRQRLQQAKQVDREDSFHEESRLLGSMRAKLYDYSGSGYDRGQLAPRADMGSRSEQYDSYSLSNVFPQAPENNRYTWNEVESATRYLTKKYGEIYVITGVTFQNKKVAQLNNRTLVPSHIFKALYIPETGEASAYYAPNDSSRTVEVISIDELILRSGIDPFPNISTLTKSTIIPFPTKTRGIEDRNSNSGSQNELKEDRPLWYLRLIELWRWLVSNFVSK